jgi:hypothetical protein
MAGGDRIKKTPFLRVVKLAHLPKSPRIFLARLIDPKPPQQEGSNATFPAAGRLCPHKLLVYGDKATYLFPVYLLGCLHTLSY